MRFLNMWSDFMFKEKILLELILTTLFFDLFSYYKSHIVFHKKSTNNLFSSFVLHSKAFQDGIIGRNPSSFGPLIKPAKSSRNSICSRILCFHTTYSNGHILSLRYQNYAIDSKAQNHLHIHEYNFYK
jgi:hypothetical protein